MAAAVCVRPLTPDTAPGTRCTLSFKKYSMGIFAKIRDNFVRSRVLTGQRVTQLYTLAASRLLSAHSLLFLVGKVEGHELPAVALVELVLELDPVQPQRMQEGREQLHAAEDLFEFKWGGRE